MIDKYRDTISGAILFILAGAYLAGSFQIRSYGDAAVDSRFFPQLLGGLLMTLSALQLILSVKNRKSVSTAASEAAPGEEAPSRFNIGVIYTLVAILAYILLINRLGFVLSSSLFLVVQTMLMAPKGKWRPLLTIVVSVIFSYVVFLIFVDGFSLVLPEGTLFE